MCVRLLVLLCSSIGSRGARCSIHFYMVLKFLCACLCVVVVVAATAAESAFNSIIKFCVRSRISTHIILHRSGHRLTQPKQLVSMRYAMRHIHSMCLVNVRTRIYNCLVVLSRVHFRMKLCILFRLNVKHWNKRNPPQVQAENGRNACLLTCWNATTNYFQCI